MKNKTGLVALLVLAVATLLMVFLVLPNIDTGDKAGTPATGDAAQNAETAGDAETAAEGATTTAKQARGGVAADTSDALPDDAAAEVTKAGEEGQPTATGNAAEAERSGDEDADAAPAGSEAQTAEAAASTSDPTADWTVPAFDVLRVEPDGSTVIAGRAEPNTKLEILNGDTVVATTEVGPSGDFAAVFDKPLVAGDYQLTLKALGEGGRSRTSEEVATISVPKDQEGELLAMVSKPGAASRLITVPEGETKADAAADPAMAEDGVATAGAAETQDAAADVDAVEETPAEPTASGDGGTGIARTEEAGRDASADVASSDTKPDAATDAAGGDVAATDMAALGEGQAGDEAGAATPGRATAGARPPLRVSAVEIEGDRMFVAGNAKPGAKVRIYANDRLLGEMKADETGNYVVDGTVSLPVGRHTIRADVMSPDGARVELRASVPFDRPAGDQVAVVARDDTAPAGTMPALSLAGGTVDKLRTEAEKAVSLLAGLYENGRLPTVEELAAARSATEIALKRLADFRPPAGEDKAVAELAAKASLAAGDALERLRALPKDIDAVGEAVAAIEAAVRTDVVPAAAQVAAVAQAAVGVADDGLPALEARARDLQGQLKALLAEGRDASTAEIQTARTAFEAALRDIEAFGAPADEDVAAPSSALKAWARNALAGLAKVPANAGRQAYAQALAAIEGVPAVGGKPAQAVATTAGEGRATAAEAASAATATDGAADAAVMPEAEAGQADIASASAADEPETLEQAPLEESKASVIIRRGDTLWQISRRVYGRGVRYTTIYLANQDQIDNPDIIQPGQIFAVPGEAAPDSQAEEFHRRHMRDG